MIHLAMRWLLEQPGVSVALWGPRHPQQMVPMDNMPGWSLSQDAMRAIDKDRARIHRLPGRAKVHGCPCQRDSAGGVMDALAKIGELLALVSGCGFVVIWSLASGAQ